MKKVNLRKSEKKILIISSIGILLTIIIGISYAYIAYSTRQEGINVIETDCINITMEELTNAIHLTNAHPITDEVGNTLKPFRFKLTNTCGVGVDYNVNLEVMETESRIASKNIATKVDENTKSILSNNPTAPITYQESDYTAVEAYTIHSGSIEPYGSVEHEVRIWLDESAGNDSQNGTFYSKVVIDARQNQTIAINFNEYIINQVEDNPSIEEFSHEATNQTVALKDYRYVGSDPNNYVCLSEEEVCSKDNLYRIIGVIPTQSEVGGEYENRIKLIKNTSYVGQTIRSGVPYGENQRGYTFSSTNSADWNSVSLSATLNGEYYNTLGKYQNYIEASVWYLGSIGTTLALTVQSAAYPGNKFTPENFYVAERTGSTSTIKNIGLMYTSDYGYSIGSEYSAKVINSNTSAYQTLAWLLYKPETNSHEWTISPSSSYSNCLGPFANIIQYNGVVYDSSTKTSVSVNSCFLGDKIDPDRSYGALNVRPTFYLKNNVVKIKGNGTEEDPYRIGIDE